MNRLFFWDNPTEFFFDNSTTTEEIGEWLSNNIISGNKLFKLNEEHSCEVRIDDENLITIKGDEDLVYVTIQPIVPVNVNLD